MATPKLVPLHPDVRRYLEKEYGLVTDSNTRYPMEELVELVSRHARKIANEAMDGIFGGENFGIPWTGPPFCMERLASFLGHIVVRGKPPLSEEAELHPNPESPGHYLIYCNPALPTTRQNFGIAHELGHTVIPPYDFRARKREAVYNDEAYSVLEALCNVAASELLLPFGAFQRELARHKSLDIESWSRIAELFDASREAVALRAVRLSSEPLAFVRFSHKLKPSEMKKPLGKQKKLRVDYCRQSNSFDHYFPPHKSVFDDCPLNAVYKDEKPYSGDFSFAFRAGELRFNVSAVFQQLPNDDGNVLALVRP